MSKTQPLHDLLDRLQIDHKTRQKTQDLFREVIHLTKPGSDYALTQGHHGLPAACLFIASLKLGNTDITKQVAQHAACIDPKTFDKVLATVERALSSRNLSPVKTKTNDITFRALVRQYQGREDACVVMAEVEAKLLQEKAVENTATPVYQGAIFSWVYINVFETSFPGEDVIRIQVHASVRDWSSARRIIDKCCSGIKATLKSQAETAISRPRTRRSQSFRIFVPPLPVTPTKKTPERTPPSTQLSKVQAMKRKAPHTNSLLMEEIITSPSKRARTMALLHSPPTTANDNFNLMTPTKSSNSVKTTEKSSTTNLDLLDDRESNSNLSTNTTTPVTASCSSLFDTSTGNPSSPRSIPSSPTEKLALSRQATRRRRVQSLSLPPLSSRKRLPILLLNDEEDILTTRQRRKLRAAFLDPDVYGWKPSTVVSRRLTLAEKWENELIHKFGDPWDDLI